MIPRPGAAALWPGAAALLALALLIGGALGGLLAAAADTGTSLTRNSDYVLAVLRFTVLQAALSALLSVGLAIPAARALARRGRFPGRGLLLRLLGLPMVVPTIVGVLGIVAIYGRSGLLNDAFAALGLPVRLDIYGLSGILIAHVFFNMPFATRLLLQGWAGIPGESWRLASQLGMSSGQMFRLIEAPMLRQVAPGVAGLVFLLCFTSFSVVLVLGGGPPNATLEVAIYQALRFDFDIPRVIALAALQVAVCAVLFAVAARLTRPIPVEMALGRVVGRHDLGSTLGRVGDAAAIGLAAAILLLPLAAVAVDGLSGPLSTALTDPALWRAAQRSLAVGLTAGGLALALGWGLVQSSRTLRVRFYRRRIADRLEMAGSLVLILPPFVVGAGLFVLLRPVADVFAIGLVLVVLVNALMGLPFVLRILGPAATEAEERHWRLCDSLGIGGWDRFRLVDWPLLRRPAGLALAICSALAFGDLGVIALFGTPQSETLPLLLYRQMGSYRTEAAAVTALVLLGLCLAMFAAIERGIGGRGSD
ncbi:MAG: thiamine/thiamine pyrophosphate ABC transporter, permease protein [Inquilinus sp.]|nr:thiamine/thiamine pyrophosphate ABC transporter, permease protein [Inquilinus sp.]